MFFWNSLAFSVIQQMLAVWSLVPLPFLNPAWSCGSSQFMYCWSLAWRILSTTLLACEMSAISLVFSSVQFSHSVVSDSLLPNESQHARPPCPSPTPKVYSNLCPSSRCYKKSNITIKQVARIFWSSITYKSYIYPILYSIKCEMALCLKKQCTTLILKYFVAHNTVSKL